MYQEKHLDVEPIKKVAVDVKIELIIKVKNVMHTSNYIGI